MLVLAAVMLASPLHASDSTKADLPLYQKPVVTKHSVSINGARIEYEATAGHLTLTREDGTVRAKIFYVSYTKVGTTDQPSDRSRSHSMAARGHQACGFTWECWVREECS